MTSVPAFGTGRIGRYGLVFAVVVSVCFLSCKKQESKEQSALTETVKKEFFDLSAIKDSRIFDFATEIQRQVMAKSSVDFFLKNNGKLIWNNADTKIFSEGIQAIIPFAFEGKGEVNGFIVARKSTQGSYSFLLFRKNLIATYGFGDQQPFSARNVQTILNKFNYELYGVTTYRIANAKQLPLEIRQQYPDRVNPKNLAGRVKVRGESANERETGLACSTYQEETQWWWDPDGDEDLCDCSGNEVYMYSTYETVTVCWQTGGGGNDGGSYGGDGNGFWGDPGGSGTADYSSLTSDLDNILRPGDLYYFTSLSGNNQGPATLGDPDNALHCTVEEFQQIRDNVTIDSTDAVTDSSEITQRARFLNMSLVTGVDVYINLKRNPATTFWEVKGVTSEKFGFCPTWTWQQIPNPSITVSGNVIFIDVFGYYEYNLIVRGIGTIFKEAVHLRMAMNKVTGHFRYIAYNP